MNDATMDAVYLALMLMLPVGALAAIFNIMYIIGLFDRSVPAAPGLIGAGFRDPGFRDHRISRRMR